MAELEWGNRDNLFNGLKAKAPDGSILDLTYRYIEMNPLLRIFPSYPANGLNGMSHTGFRWISEVTPTVSVIGGGISSSIAQGQNFTEDMVLLESRYQVPVSVLEHWGPLASTWRSAQEQIHEKSMQRAWTSTIIRGTAATSTTRINGLRNRAPWNTITADYCYDMGGGASNLRSMWLVNPGPTTAHLIHNPNLPTLGVSRTPQPKQLVTVTDTDANGSGTRWDEFTDFKFEQGLCVYDNMCIKHLANNDYTAAVTASTFNTIVEARTIHSNYMVGQWYLLVDPRMYINLINYRQTINNVQFSSDNPWGVSLPMIGDIIILNIEALNYTETQVT